MSSCFHPVLLRLSPNTTLPIPVIHYQCSSVGLSHFLNGYSTVLIGRLFLAVSPMPVHVVGPEHRSLGDYRRLPVVPPVSPPNSDITQSWTLAQLLPLHSIPLPSCQDHRWFILLCTKLGIVPCFCQAREPVVETFYSTGNLRAAIRVERHTLEYG
jgi:hypothetical protein